jgi:hypothetical protein
LKRELKEVQEELISAKLIMELLQTEGSTNDHVGYGTIEPRNLIQSNELNAEKTKENKWNEVIPKYRKTKRVKSDRSKRQVEIENRYNVLENLQEPTEIMDGLELGKVKYVTNICRRTLKKDHKVILIGDSRAWECAERISNYLGNTYEVTGYVNPGSGLEVITYSAKKEIDHLTPKYVVVVCGGANNIGKNESIKGLKYVTQFVQNRRNTNVVIMNAPHRFDLEESSCVNEEIKVFNRKLKKIMKIYNLSEVVDMSAHRDHYTKHGLHMNKRGKDWLTRRTADTINK